MSVVPGNGVWWCRGANCGRHEVCRDDTFNEGYCLEPVIRLAKCEMPRLQRKDTSAPREG